MVEACTRHIFTQSLLFAEGATTAIQPSKRHMQIDMFLRWNMC